MQFLIDMIAFFVKYTGSNACEAEEETVMLWINFLQELEGS